MTDNNIHEGPISNPEEQKIEVEPVSNLSVEIPQANQKIQHLRGWYVIVILLLIIAFGTIMSAVKFGGDILVSSWDLIEVGNELLDYVEKNNQQFPAAEKWCDAMLEKEDKYYSFQRYKDNKEDFPYTLNKHIFGHKEIPDNMVVLFPVVSGWNQVGDLDLVQNHDRLQVFLGNGDIRTFRKNQIPYLRWKLEDSGVIPKANVKRPLVAISAILIVVFLSIFITYRECLKIFWMLALGIGITSAIAGAFLGNLAEFAYYKLGSTGVFVSPLIGCIWGFVIGAAFIVIIGKIYKKYNAEVSMIGYATVIGAITGIAASSIVHGYLMIVYEEKSFSYLIAGSCFGIIAGVLIGWISSGLIRFYKNKPAILKVTTK